MNILISLCAMALGDSSRLHARHFAARPYRAVRAPIVSYVQIFRNAPHLVLIFATTYIFPFEIVVFGNYIAFPDWVKAVIGLAIPASAYVAEITRGAIQSIPTAQWEAATASAFRACRRCAGSFCLPQCLRARFPRG